MRGKRFPVIEGKGSARYESIIRGFMARGVSRREAEFQYADCEWMSRGNVDQDYPLLVTRLLGDIRSFDCEAIGAILKIILYRKQMFDTPLPDDDRRVARFLRMSARKFGKLKPFIAQFFDLSGGAWEPKTEYFAVVPPLRLHGSEWDTLRLAVFERDNFTCVYCGSVTESPECDHVHPIALGGSNDVDNLATACGSCNASKGAKTLAEWQGRHG